MLSPGSVIVGGTADVLVFIQIQLALCGPCLLDAVALVQALFQDRLDAGPSR